MQRYTEKKLLNSRSKQWSMAVKMQYYIQYTNSQKLRIILLHIGLLKYELAAHKQLITLPMSCWYLRVWKVKYIFLPVSTASLQPYWSCFAYITATIQYSVKYNKKVLHDL